MPLGPHLQSSSSGGFRARLTRYYERYEPQKLQRIDQILDSFAGQQEHLFRLLVAHYGPELPVEVADSQQSLKQPPVQQSAAPLKSKHPREVCRGEIVSLGISNELYDALYDIFHGRTNVLSSQLSAVNRSRHMRKFSIPDVVAPGDTDEVMSRAIAKARLWKYLSVGNGVGANITHVWEMLWDWSAGSVDDAVILLAPVIGLENHYVSDDISEEEQEAIFEETADFFKALKMRQHARFVMRSHDLVCCKDVFFRFLQAERALETEVVVRAKEEVSHHRLRKDYFRRRISSLLEVYDPVKVADLTNLLACYDGNEMALLRHLVTVYGEEPDPVLSTEMEIELRGLVVAHLARTEAGVPQPHRLQAIIKGFHRREKELYANLLKQGSRRSEALEAFWEDALAIPSLSLADEASAAAEDVTDYANFPIMADGIVELEASEREVTDFEEYVHRSEVLCSIRTALEEASIMAQVTRDCKARRSVFEREALLVLGRLPGSISRY
jgi:hypothetical protein